MFLGSDVPAPSGSVGQVSNRQGEPLLRREDDLHVAYWNARTLQDIGVIKVSGEEACYHFYHSGMLAWVPISSRLTSAQLNGTTVNLTAIAVYAKKVGRR